jgi:hypothetical protein
MLFPGIIITVMDDEIGEAGSTHGRDEKCIHFAGKYEGKGPLAGPRHTRMENIRRNLKEIGWKV